MSNSVEVRRTGYNVAVILRLFDKVFTQKAPYKETWIRPLNGFSYSNSPVNEGSVVEVKVAGWPEDAWMTLVQEDRSQPVFERCHIRYTQFIDIRPHYLVIPFSVSFGPNGVVTIKLCRESLSDDAGSEELAIIEGAFENDTIVG